MTTKSLKERLEKVANAAHAHAQFVSEALGGGEPGSECYGFDDAEELKSIAQALQEQADEMTASVAASHPTAGWISGNDVDKWADALAPRNEAPGREGTPDDG